MVYPRSQDSAARRSAHFMPLAHATRSTESATIVMPTGTRKTETMLALNAHQRFERLLVVVPIDALHEQIAGKFETFRPNVHTSRSPDLTAFRPWTRSS